MHGFNGWRMLAIFFTDDIPTFVMGSQRRPCYGCVGGHLQRYDQCDIGGISLYYVPSLGNHFLGILPVFK